MSTSASAPSTVIGAPATVPLPGAGGIDPVAVFIACLVFALFQFAPALLNDGDTLWHIRTGEWMLDHRAMPATDPFSFTAAARPWFLHEWLAEILMALAFRVGGLQGVMTLAAGAVGLTAAIMLHHLRRFLPGVYAVAALTVGLGNAAPGMLARPHILAWPCLALWCGGLVAARARRSTPSFALLPVMVLWVNLHGSFIVGLLLPGAFLAEALLDPGADRCCVARSWALFILAAWAAALCNPQFAERILFPFRLLDMQSLALINEWQPPSFATINPLELTILGGLALGFYGKVHLPPIRMLLLLGLVYGALSHARHGQLLGIVGALVLAEPVAACLPHGVASSPGRAWRRLAGVAAVLALVAMAGRIALPLGPARSGAAFAAVLAHVPPALRARPVLNEYGIGGALIFNGVRPFIDSRADLYGDAFIVRYDAIMALDHAELARTIAEYGIAWAIFPAAAPLVQLLDREPGWHRLAEGDGLVIDAIDDPPARDPP
jgi:hypothetical protein